MGDAGCSGCFHACRVDVEARVPELCDCGWGEILHVVGGAPVVIGGHDWRFVGGDVGECNRLGVSGVGGVVWDDGHGVDGVSPLEWDVDLVG